MNLPYLALLYYFICVFEIYSNLLQFSIHRFPHDVSGLMFQGHFEWPAAPAVPRNTRDLFELQSATAGDRRIGERFSTSAREPDFQGLRESILVVISRVKGGGIYHEL